MSNKFIRQLAFAVLAGLVTLFLWAIITTLWGALVAGATVASSWSAAAAFATKVGLAIWKVIAFTVPVPLSFASLCVVAALAVIRKRLLALRSPPVNPLKALEDMIVDSLMHMSQKWTSVVAVSDLMDLPDHITEQALQNLFDKGMLRRQDDYMAGTTVSLSAIGKDYAKSRHSPRH